MIYLFNTAFRTYEAQGKILLRDPPVFTLPKRLILTIISNNQTTLVVDE